jgi:hypothetical protein
MKTIVAVIMLMLVSISAHAVPITMSGTLKITGGAVDGSAALSGIVDTAANTLSFNPSKIYGQTAKFPVSELLAPGTYTRTYTTPSGSSLTRTATIPSGTTGGYFVIETYGTWYQVFNAWTVSADGKFYTAVSITGNALIGGPLDGRKVTTDFSEPAPVMSLTIDVAGGTIRECTSPSGDTVAFSSNVTIQGNTQLDRVDWYLDNVFAGSGNAINLSMPVGLHVVRAQGVATDGTTTASDQENVEVKDTTSPVLGIQFLNSQGQPVTSASVGGYTVHFVVSDVCDASPVVTTATAKPVLSVVEGDTITINSTSDVHLPTTAVEVTAMARDVNGRTANAQATLAIQ